MKIIFFVLFLGLCAGYVFVEECGVAQNRKDSEVVNSLSKNAGVRIDPALKGKLTVEQFNDLTSLLSPVLEIPLDSKKQSVGWNRYLTHLTVEERYSDAAMLQEKEVIKVAKVGSVTREEFNPTFFCGSLFIIAVFFAYLILGTTHSRVGIEMDISFALFLLVFLTCVGIISGLRGIPEIDFLVLFPFIPLVLFLMGILLESRGILCMCILGMLGFLTYVFAVT
ncbi:hypothetical protein IPH92_03255 [Candidatus Kaiserbacteria bacterium]|nr:MAG: hypothetical protein IPH92_03255 [Candidatus Kaiserbacteria bacterium]